MLMVTILAIVLIAIAVALADIPEETVVQLSTDWIGEDEAEVEYECREFYVDDHKYQKQEDLAYTEMYEEELALAELIVRRGRS